MGTGYDKSAFFKQVLREYQIKAEQTKTSGQGISTGIPILTESSLRLEQFIGAQTTQYNFPVLAGQSSVGSVNVLPTEVRLETNDNFHIAQIGFYLAVTNDATDVDFRLLTNNNEIAFGAADVALNYGIIYNGLLKININQVDVLTNYRLNKHFVVNQTQRLSAAVNNNFDQIDMEYDGLIPLQPSIMLSGAYTNIITINLPAAVTLALALNNSRIVMIYDGLRAQNAAVRKGAL